MNFYIIDPYMYELKEEEEINDNLFFFELICDLIKNNQIKVIVYNDLLNSIFQRSIKPFPIFPDKIHNDKLKEKILCINSIFSSVLMYGIIPLEISNCTGNQSIETKSNSDEITSLLNNDSKYFELCYILIQKCFNTEYFIESKILTGYKSKGLKIGDHFHIACNCSAKSFNETFNVDSVNEILNHKEKALFQLINMANNGDISFIESPTIIRGDHHNFFQKNSNFSSYSGISSKNKQVIKLLRKFGLYKIVLGKSRQKSPKAIKTITASNVISNDKCDIVKGWLYAETECGNRVDLYFPPNIGKYLKDYLNSDFSYNSISRLCDLLNLR